MLVLKKNNGAAMIISTIVTKTCLKDFLLMKKTFDLYHENSFYDIACDSYSFEYLNKNYKNIECAEYSFLKDGDHVENEQEKNSNFETIIQIKFEHTIKVLTKYQKQILWCDVDHVFINKLEEFVYEDKNDACVTPHFSNNFANEAEVGYFNCGFVIIKNIKFLEYWYELYKRRKELNIYYEQKALELTCKKFRTTNLPISYNIGWWKFMNLKYEGNSKFLETTDREILFFKNKAINFHFHIFKKSNHCYDQNQSIGMLINLLKQRARTEDMITIYEIERLKNENI
jgi:hypothetical protein